jgi:predicted glycoside hydrolase/deacetylase ChbG (UPF0249 family)
MTALADHQTNWLLGYPDDARLLIINADDFGMCHASNEATLRALREGVATSTTLMTPCPWAPHAMRMLREHPEIPFGVHLTLVSDFAIYRWGPVASKNTVSSLVDEAGFFLPSERIPELLGRARLDEVEREYRAQIEAVLAAGLQPTHLDWHCIADGGRPDITELTIALAREYGLAMRAHERSTVERCRRMGLPVGDHGVLDSYRLDPDEKAARYVQLLRELPAGLSEWAVHPSLGDAEAQALEPETWCIRRADLDFFVSDEARKVLDEEGIVLLSYRELQRVWAAAL